ncbi:MAG TPA: glutaminase [Microlunatus sp.]
MRFSELSLDSKTRRPRNPMINAGAITASSLLPGGGPDQQLAGLLAYLSAFVDHPLEIDERVYASEAATGHRNRAIAHLLRSVDVIGGDPMAAVDVYVRQCSIRVTARDLALFAATLANGGLQSTTGRLLVSRAVFRRVLSVLASCGMYDGAGHWLTEVGLPAKSGVSGGILAVPPSQFGVASYAPPLNEHGNSVRGVAAFRSLSERSGSHLFEPRVGRLHTVRHRTQDADEVGTVRYALQGDLDVAGTESVLWQLMIEPTATRRVVVDLTATDRISGHAGELLAEMSRRYWWTGERWSSSTRRSYWPAPRTSRPAALRLGTGMPSLQQRALLGGGVDHPQQVGSVGETIATGRAGGVLEADQDPAPGAVEPLPACFPAPAGDPPPPIGMVGSVRSG